MMTAPTIQAPQSFAQTVVDWQKVHGRHGLPWMVNDAYLRWLSEIMLQQTQVSVVLDYFHRFTERFPTVEDLAAAPEGDVMALWAGLGYYSRARNLHAAAKSVMHDFGGQFPQTLEELMTLPGVGRSTAAAIASFCFDVAEPVLDGNVKRVLSRVTTYEEAVDTSIGEKALLGLARKLVHRDEPGVYNQGMMDVGATICTRTNPKCDCCPLNGLCRAFMAGSQESYPIKKLKIKRSDRTLRLAWVESDGKVLLIERQKGDIWPGLWCLPEMNAQLQTSPIARDKRVLTHLNLTIEVYRAKACDVRAADSSHSRWVSLTDADERSSLGMPAPVRKIVESLAASGLVNR